MPKAQDIRAWLESIDAVSTVSEQDFYRYYMPRDPSINRPDSTPGWMVNVNTDALVMDITNVRCNPGLGQRRFTAIATHAVTGANAFVKDVYREERHKFLEGNLFEKAHDNGRSLPGLVRAYFHGYLRGEAGSVITTTTLRPGLHNEPPVKRCKTRIVTLDVGLPLREVKSLRGFLGIMYDACVVQRNLYRKCKVLHRDISDNNIMIAPRDEGIRERWKGGYHEVKYLNQVLARNTQTPPEPEPTCLVVDLGNAVDLEEIDSNSGILATVIGTPKFMARSISRHKPLPRARHLPRPDESKLPILEGESYDLCAVATGTEYEAYNQKFNEVLSGSSPVETRFVHQLFHDAESTFWVIAWFLACAAPKGYESETTWTDEFTRFIRGMQEHRPNDPKVEDFRLLFEPGDWNDILHHKLASVAPMLTQMHTYIDPEWSYRPGLYAEHAHEALMRLLLMEIVRIEARPTEDVEFAGRIRDLPARTEPTSSHSPSTTTHTPSSLAAPRASKRSRSQSSYEEPERNSRPNPRSTLVNLQETDQTNRSPSLQTDDIIDNARKHV